MVRKKQERINVNLNIPKETLEKIEDIGRMKGFNRTQMILVCINNYIDQLETMNYMPKVLEIIKAEQKKEIEDALKNNK